MENNSYDEDNSNSMENENAEDCLEDYSMDIDFEIDNTNKTLKLKPFFEEKMLENNEKYKEPDWTLLIYNWMTPKIKIYFFQEKMFKKILNDANIIFLEGILYEYGDQGYEQSYEKALEKYHEGMKQNNQYCLYRMYFILIDDHLCEKFQLKKSFELALIFLIKSCAYNECYLEMSKIEPAHKLSAILQSIYKKTEFLHKCIDLHEKNTFITKIK